MWAALAIEMIENKSFGRIVSDLCECSTALLIISLLLFFKNPGFYVIFKNNNMAGVTHAESWKSQVP